MSVETLLEVELQDEFERLSEIRELGTDKHIKAVDSVAKLMDRAIEIEKLEQTRAEQEQTRKSEEALKRQQMKEDKIDRIIKNTLTGISIGGGFALAIWGTIVTMNFEKEDTFTSTAGKKHVSRLFSMFK